MLIVLSLFFAVIWLIFFKFQWLPWSRGWKITVYTIALAIALVVVGALQYYTPASVKAVVAAQTQQVYPLVTGRIETTHINGAQAVQVGDKLFTIDPRPFQYAVDKWTAAVKIAEVELADANKLVAGGNIARIARDQKQAEYDQAVAELDNARYELENTVVVAPGNGYITLNTLHAGQRVNSQSAALTFLDRDAVTIVVAMKQNGMAGIAPGKKVSVVFPAAPGEIYQSEVISTVEGTIQGQITMEYAASPLDAVQGAPSLYPIKVAFPEDAPDSLRQPGKLAEVTVFTDESNPINILARILQWITTWLNFIL